MIVVEAVHLYHLKFEGSERGGKIHVTTYVDFVRAWIHPVIKIWHSDLYNIYSYSRFAKHDIDIMY